MGSQRRDSIDRSRSFTLTLDTTFGEEDMRKREKEKKKGGGKGNGITGISFVDDIHTGCMYLCQREGKKKKEFDYLFSFIS